MTSLIVLALGVFGAGFIVGASLVHWACKPVQYEHATFERERTWELPPDPTPLNPPENFQFTILEAGKPGYKGSENDCR